METAEERRKRAVGRCRMCAKFDQLQTCQEDVVQLQLCPVWGKKHNYLMTNVLYCIYWGFLFPFPPLNDFNTNAFLMIGLSHHLYTLTSNFIRYNVPLLVATQSILAWRRGVNDLLTF